MSDEPVTSRRSVLVVDDEPGVRAVLDRELRKQGYDVVTAATGDEALSLLERYRPAVILSDVHMPGMDGHALLRHLTAIGAEASVVLMSGQGEVEDVIGALREGAVDYLQKPWTLAALAAVLGRAMNLFDACHDLMLAPTFARTTTARRAAGQALALDAAALIEEVAGEAARGTLSLPPVSVALARVLDHPGDGGDRSEEPAIDVLAASALLDAFPIRVAELRTLNQRIWRFSVSRALSMRGIADIVEPERNVDREECYLAGLLLDVGASFLLSSVGEGMERSGSGIQDVGGMVAALSSHHAAVGSRIVEQWRSAHDSIPASVPALARGHDTSPSSPPPLWCVAALGGAMAARLAGFGDPTGNRELSAEFLARCAYTLGLGDTTLRVLARSTGEEASHIWAAVP